jgi:hypothetical protein
MRPILARSAVLFAPLAALALVLGGCSGETPDEDPSVTEDADEPTEEPTDEETEPVEEDDSEPAAGGGAACVEGTWVSDADAIAASTTSAIGMDELGAEATVTGGSVTTFAGTAITQEYTDQVTEVSWSMEGQEFRLVTRFDGTLTATATITDDQITIAEVDDSALTFESSTSIGGEEIEIPGIADTISSGFEMGGTSSYSCSGDELRMTPIVEGVDTSGYVTVLRRQ